LQEKSNQPQDAVPQDAAPIEKLIHLALPVRLTHMATGGRGALEMACTYDVHSRGARLLSFRHVKVGDLVTVERGRNRSVCRVVWTADPRSALRGQFTVESVDGAKVPWEDELRQMEEQYLPVIPEGPVGRSAMNAYRRGDQNRRRRPRFPVEGCADFAEISGKTRLEGRLAQISELGCLITAPDMLVPGTGLRLVLNLYDVSVALKGQVKCMTEKFGMGIEFQEIRQGDRPLLSYVLDQLGKRRSEDFSDLEVITEVQASAGSLIA
jgi:hypothetical protein